LVCAEIGTPGRYNDRGTGGAGVLTDPLDKKFTAALDALRMQYEAGLDLPRSLRGAADVAQGPGRRALHKAADATVANNDMDEVLNTLSPMTSYPDRMMLAAGWQGGRLDHALQLVVHRRQRLHDARKHIRSGLVLPAILLVVGCMVPPLPNLILGNIGPQQYLWRALTPLAWGVAAVTSWILYLQWRQRQWSRRPIHAPPPPPMPDDWLLLHLPLVRGMEHWRNRSTFAGLMAASLSAGITMVESLRLTARAMPNGVYRQAVDRHARDILKGLPLAQCMARWRGSGRFGGWPDSWIALVEVGEISGKLDETMDRLADQAYDNYLGAIAAFSAWVPRIVYAVVSIYLIQQILALWAQMYGPLFQMLGKN
jgi:type II secretory pathway component PulF